MTSIPELIEAFDLDMRRTPPPERAGVRVEFEPRIRRSIGVGGGGWFAVEWSDLDDETADEAIAREVEIFGALGQAFEWKYYDYDRPADLERRLIAAGFRAEDDESVMIGEIQAMPRSAPPDGVRIVEVTDAQGVEKFLEANRLAFGRDHVRYRETLLSIMGRDDTVLAMAVAGDEAVSAARLEMPGTGRFASLWGGGTVPAWRGRGIYRALVSYRADIAAARGYRFLHVDASPDSRPILERLGFVRIARTTPYHHEPS